MNNPCPEVFYEAPDGLSWFPLDEPHESGWYKQVGNSVIGPFKTEAEAEEA